MSDHPEPENADEVPEEDVMSTSPDLPGGRRPGPHVDLEGNRGVQIGSGGLQINSFGADGDWNPVQVSPEDIARAAEYGVRIGPGNSGVQIGDGQVQVNAFSDEDETRDRAEDRPRRRRWRAR